MPDIAILPARLTTLIIESFLYGLLLLLFISTLYFLATQRTLAGTTHSARHHFTSLVFFGVTALFLVVTMVGIVSLAPVSRDI
jgi:cell division protein FtsW (lipid II flippase)